MKKQVVSVVTILSMTFGTFLFIGCGGETTPKAEEQQAEEVEEHEGHEDGHMEHSDEHAHAAKYQCTMDCEDGKTYDEAGKCPVCKMDLVEVEGEEHEEGDEHGEEAHEHDHDEA